MCCEEKANNVTIKKVSAEDILKNLPVTVYEQPELSAIVPGDVKVYTNGDLEFLGDIPESINGYEQDADNPRLFHRQWSDCKHRLTGAKLPKFDLVMVCHGDVPTLMQRVTAQQCAACPLANKNKGQQS